MALYSRGFAQPCLDHVGIYRTLRQVVDCAYAPGFVLEHAYELLADYLALALGLAHARKLAQEPVLRVDPHEVDVPLAECRLDLVAFILAHQAVIHEHARQLPSDRLRQQRRRYRRVHAARQCQQYPAVAYLGAQLFYRLLAVVAHRPVALDAARAVQEVAYHVDAVFGIADLGVELHAVQMARLARYRRVRATRRPCRNLESVRHLGHVVAVTHPGHAVAVQPRKQRAVGIEFGFGMAVLASAGIAGGLDLTAQVVRHQLAAVAYAQYRYACVEQRRVDLGRTLGVNAARSAGEYYARRRICQYLVKRHCVRLYLAEHVALAHAPRYQLVVLSAKVKHQYPVHRSTPPVDSIYVTIVIRVQLSRQSGHR